MQDCEDAGQLLKGLSLLQIRCSHLLLEGTSACCGQIQWVCFQKRSDSVCETDAYRTNLAARAVAHSITAETSLSGYSVCIVLVAQCTPPIDLAVPPLHVLWPLYCRFSSFSSFCHHVLMVMV